MDENVSSNRIGIVMIIVSSLFAFIFASGEIFSDQPLTFKIIALFVPILGYFSYRMLQNSPLKKQLGLGMVINGMVFWGVGWMIILLVDPIVGWWVYVAGWLALSIGFLIYGAVEANKRQLPNYAFALLLLGLLPVMVELASPYRFATELKASGQLLVMFAFSFGWILIGLAFQKLPNHVHQLEKLPAQLLPQTK